MNIDLSHLISLLKRIGISFLIFSICRFLFYIFHLSFFGGEFPFDAFFFGLRFDVVAISYLLSPFIFFSILPFPFRIANWYQKFLKILFHISNSIGIIFNLIDLGYYQYSLKRTTADIFNFLGTGNDFWGMLPQYVIDFWYAFLFLILLILLSEYLYRKTTLQLKSNITNLKYYLSQSFILIICSGLLIIGFRGGIQLKPLDVINAANYTKPKYVPVILNTPFSVIKTLLNDQLPKIDFYDDRELEKIYTPVQSINATGKLKGKNVVIVILESFAKEYVGFLNDGKGFTPFLDSLATDFYIFTNAYSNGTRSIEALPSIYAGLPPLMHTPYIISNFSSDKLDALPRILKNNGYNTSFYHGGSNGTMGFNGFVKICGVDNYYGLDEYPNKEKDYDHHWGISDEPYLQYFASELNNKKEPFFSTIFTLSSHHPYNVPEKYKGIFPEGELPIHKTIGYTDFSLKKFFDAIKNKDWFKNTVFVFTADHSSNCVDPKYSTIIGRFEIPIFIYDPSGTIKGKNLEYFQHCDITPTILDLLGINTNIISFGKDYHQKKRFLVGYSRNSYFIMKNNFVLLFDGEKSTGLYDYNADIYLFNNLLNQKDYINKQLTLEQKLKAIIQQHNNRLIENKLSISNF